jgi:poly(glycerol-phosphate) alpha-glucosyltransferase
VVDDPFDRAADLSRHAHCPEDGGRRTEDGSRTSIIKNEFQLSTFPISTFAEGRKVLLYLGRIHPKKGLVNLLKAWAAIQKAEGRGQRAEWVLAIAGWDQGGHLDELKRLCDELEIVWQDQKEHSTFNIQHSTSNMKPGVSSQWSVVGRPPSVLFLGPKFGEEKEALYRNCDAFILPSFSEGLPMVVLEAWAYGKPVLMTPECNLPEGFAAGAALRIEQGAESGERGAGGGEQGAGSIERGLQELFQAPDSALQALGTNGRALVAERFAWPKIAADMKSVYEWVLGGGEKPGCVQTKS